MTTGDYLTQLVQDRDDLVDNLTTKGITGLTGDETFTELVPEVLNIPTGGGTVEAEKKDINFYDYDGTRLYSYSLAEFENIVELPALPNHDGLICQGWNWTLASIKAEGKPTDIGAMYITDDGKTRIYIHLEDGRLEPYLGFAVNGTATIDWGDGSATQNVTGTSTSSPINTQHTYTQAGDYVISISSESTIYISGYSSYGCRLLWNQINNVSSTNRTYQNAIQKIELGNRIVLNDYSFQYCRSLKSITIPNNIISIGNTIFSQCSSLLNIILPNNITSIGNSVVYNCYSLLNVILPNSITSIGSSTFSSCYSLSDIKIPKNVISIDINAFYNCYTLSSIIMPSSITNINNRTFTYCESLTHIKIPSSVSNISNEAFSYCYSMAYYDFTSHTSIPTLGTSVFSGIPADCKIIVPDNLYEDWIVATNWSNYASRIIKESDWNNS